MKKILFSLAVLCCGIFMNAQQLADLDNGYYRVHNHGSDRYIYVFDNTGSINVSSATADMGAISLIKGLENTISDPASVLFLEKHGDQYDITAQSTGIYEMISTYLNLMTSPKFSGAYYAYGKKGGQVVYLYDSSSNPSVNESYLTTTGAEELRNWYVTPIDNSTDNYFGVAPTISAAGKYYQPFFADFPFSFAGTGMKAYYVKSVDEKRGLAIYTEISGTVARSTPVFIECASTKPADNKLNIGGTATAVTDNLLSGVYFESEAYKHVNLTTYKSNMRSLAVLSDGSLGLVKGDYKNVPRNQFYLTVSDSAPAEFKLVTQDEYDYILAHEVVEATAINLSATSITLKIGDTQTLTATVVPDNTTDKTVAWSTSDAAVASVDNNGKVTALAVGNATITAKCGNVTATCTVTVNPIEATAVTLDKTSVTLHVDETAELKATVAPDNTTDKTVAWTTSDANVATVDASGKVKAVGLGTATITATCGTVSASCTVTVEPVMAENITLDQTKITINVDNVVIIVATVAPDNTTDKTVVWTSSDPEVAIVDSNGTVTAKSIGTAIITATCGSVSATCEVVVSPIMAESISIDLADAEIFVDESVKLTATVLPENATDITVIWSTSDASIATVDVNGNVTGVSEGTAVIKAACGDVEATCTVVVKKKEGGINDILNDAAGSVDIYNLQGIRVRSNATSTDGLPRGVYIINGEKYFVR